MVDVAQVGQLLRVELVDLSARAAEAGGRIEIRLITVTRCARTSRTDQVPSPHPAHTTTASVVGRCQGYLDRQERHVSEPIYAGAAESRSNGVAIVAIVTGIIALLLSWIPGINLLAFLLGLIAIVTGAIGLRKAGEPGVGGKGQAITGLVTGVLALIVGVLVYVGIASFVQNNPELQQELERIQEEQQQQG
jgi:hypothetical protein